MDADLKEIRLSASTNCTKHIFWEILFLIPSSAIRQSIGCCAVSTQYDSRGDAFLKALR